jgi:NAD(P)H-nitrite reductase large subunit
VLGIELISIGIVEAVGADIFEIVLEEESEHRYRKLVIRGINIIGAILLGYPEYVDVVKKAIHDVWDISEQVDDLRSGNWSYLNQSLAAA